MSTEKTKIYIAQFCGMVFVVHVGDACGKDLILKPVVGVLVQGKKERVR